MLEGKQIDGFCVAILAYLVVEIVVSILQVLISNKLDNTMGDTKEPRNISTVEASQPLIPCNLVQGIEESSI